MIKHLVFGLFTFVVVYGLTSTTTITSTTTKEPGRVDCWLGSPQINRPEYGCRACTNYTDYPTGDIQAKVGCVHVPYRLICTCKEDYCNYPGHWPSTTPKSTTEASTTESVTGPSKQTTVEVTSQKPIDPSRTTSNLKTVPVTGPPKLTTVPVTGPLKLTTVPVTGPPKPITPAP